MGEPRDLPILFSAPMVRALLDGRKTQTRRVCRVYQSPHGERDEDGWPWRVDAYGDYHREVSPYGQPGDRLWVRETWLELDREHWGDRSLPREAIYNHPWPRVNACAYRADTSSDGEEARRSYGYRWRPSIHMPRWAARLTLKVTGVRVERLQLISEEDAWAEGVVRLEREDRTLWRDYEDAENGRPNARQSFETLWRSTNGPESWKANPWVWVVSFTRVESAR